MITFEILLVGVIGGVIGSFISSIVYLIVSLYLKQNEKRVKREEQEKIALEAMANIFRKLYSSYNLKQL